MKSKVLQRKMFRDPSQDENVGIMQGFKDDLDEMLGAMGSEDSSEQEDDGGAAKAMDRKPNSPEILMNNLRGDMRSVDARVEELADMVGYNAASNTPPEVLALLQPVLKQQGIAALPAGGMDQGSAMPPPGAPSANMPPPGMAPPSDGAPPMSPPAGGGIASLPQGAPPMAQGPQGMARGGYVQHFQDGSDANGVQVGGTDPVFSDGTGEEDDTRLTDTSSNDWSNLTPEQITAARTYTRNYLAQPPTPTPTLQEKMAEYVPIYKTLLGQDKGATQSQMLFDISQRALNYAGNVNDRGEAMRGSQAARLAGAFASLPAAIGARVSAMAKDDQAINLAALQAGEKDINSIRAANTKLLDEKMKIQLGIAKGKPGSDNPFGTSLNGRILNIFRNGAAAYASGSTSQDQDRIFESAVSQYTIPTTESFMDPTGRQITRTRVNPLPDFVVEALAKRKSLGTISPKHGSPGLNVLTAGSEIIGQDGEGNPVTQDMLDNMPSGPTANANTVADANTGAAPIAPPNAMAPNFNPSMHNYNVKQDSPNIFNSASGTGPMGAISSAVGSLPLVGNWAMQGLDQNSVNKRTYIRNQANTITAALQNSPTYAQQERKQIEGYIDILPGILDNKQAFEQRTIQLDTVLEQKMLAAQAELNNINKKPQNEITRADAERLSDAQATLSILNNVRTILGVPARIHDPNDSRLKTASPGTLFSFNGEVKAIPYPKTP
jgi:hypothetical protein